jgi:hypothetical protein
MATGCGILTTWWGVYSVSMIAPLTRWCQSPYPKEWFLFLFSSFVSRNILATYPWTSSYDRALDQVLEQSCPFRANFFIWNSKWRFSIRSCKFASSVELWESPPWILSWYFLLKAGVIYRLSESFQCCFWCSIFLLKSLKVVGIASSHFIAPHHGHHEYSITYTSTPKCILILSKSVVTQCYGIVPWKCCCYYSFPWVSSRWLYLWSPNHVGIILKLPRTLWITLWILQLLWPIKRAHDRIILSHFFRYADHDLDRLIMA